jgi:hypothetical protein
MKGMDKIGKVMEWRRRLVKMAGRGGKEGTGNVEARMKEKGGVGGLTPASEI